MQLSNPMLLPEFFYLFLGKPGSGKSFLIEEMIINEQLYRGKFNSIIFLSPNVIGEMLELDKDNHVRTLDFEFIKHNIDIANQRVDKSKFYNLLIVIDDLLSAVYKEQNNPFLIDIFFNRRHIIDNGAGEIRRSTQKYTLVQAKYRAVLSGV